MEKEKIREKCKKLVNPTKTVGKCTKKLLERAEKNHICVYATYEMPKSFIITMKDGLEKLYISQLSAMTLKKRMGLYYLKRKN